MHTLHEVLIILDVDTIFRKVITVHMTRQFISADNNADLLPIAPKHRCRTRLLRVTVQVGLYITLERQQHNDQFVQFCLKAVLAGCQSVAVSNSLYIG